MTTSNREPPVGSSVRAGNQGNDGVSVDGCRQLKRQKTAIDGRQKLARSLQVSIINGIAGPPCWCDSARMMEGAPVARLRRVVRVALATLATLFGIFGSPATAQQPQRIIAVGDLHGDFQAWTTIAQAAGITDTRGHWMGGKTTLVQLGDVTDRGPESLKIIRNLQQLQNEAPKKGGRVVVVLGNHEAMNLLGDNRYTSAGEYAAFVDSGSAARRDRVYDGSRVKLEAFYKSQDANITPDQVHAKWMAEHPLGWVEHKLAWSPSGDLGKWATANPAIVKIDGTLFAHGGISAEYARQPL